MCRDFPIKEETFSCTIKTFPNLIFRESDKNCSEESQNEVLHFQDLIPPQNDSLHIHVETYIFEISKIGESASNFNIFDIFNSFIVLPIQDSFKKIR